MAFTDAATTHVKDRKEGKDYSDGAKNIKSVYETVGLKDVCVSESYTKAPEPDSIAFIIGSKDIVLNNKKTIKLITTTIRSASYGKEWASNVKLGTSGEAQGFREAATQVFDALKAYTDKYIDNCNGRISFWIHGFSRGGATANLTAKRLVDNYQQKGNKVYAYCLEAPQGGVKSEELAKSDYRCIHNVINPNDLVPFVAPTKYGFKRYGVDHYLSNEHFNSDKLVKSKLFENNLADNVPYESPHDELLHATASELLKLIPNAADAKEYAPYTYQRYEISIKKTGIVKGKTNMSTDAYLKSFIDNLASTTTRNEFSTKGLEKALRNLMIYTNSGADLDSLKDQFGWMDYTLLVSDCIIPSIVEGIVEVAEDFWYDILDTLHIKERKTEQIPLSSGFRERIANAVVERISRKEEIKKEFDKLYPGKLDQACKDINSLVYYALGGFTGIDDTISLVKNIDGILQNHTLTQTLAYLRAEDSWYELYIIAPMW